MAATAAHIRANNKYMNKAYDRVTTLVTKGDKATIQAHAAARGESLNGFVNRAIKQAIQADNASADDTQTE